MNFPVIHNKQIEYRCLYYRPNEKKVRHIALLKTRYIYPSSIISRELALITGCPIKELTCLFSDSYKNHTQVEYDWGNNTYKWVPNDCFKETIKAIQNLLIKN